MSEKEHPLTNTCNFSNVRPIMMDLPYPPLQVKEKNPAYANILSFDYCGSVSELSAIAQYINNENRMSGENCPLAQTILGIAVAEMIHLQKLGVLIQLLGGTVDFVARQNNGKATMWSPECVTLPKEIRQMLLTDIESEKAAIRQYRMHMNVIRDNEINAVLARIIKDEEYHIMLLNACVNNLR